MINQVQLPRHITNPNPRIYESDNYVVFDFETTNRDFGSALDSANRLVLSTWKVGIEHPRWRRGSGVSYSYSSQLPSELVRAVDEADFIICQNAKFELQWLARCGVDISKIVAYDTMVGEYVRLGNRRGPKDLDSIAKRYALGQKSNLVKLLMQGGVCPSRIPETWLISYGCGDTDVTEKVFLSQRVELRELGLLPHLYTRCLLTPVLADIERHGMFLDGKAVYSEYKSRFDSQERASGALSLKYPGVNWGSTKQMGVFLYETLGFSELTNNDGSENRTDGGGRRTDGDTLLALEAKTDAQREFKELLKPLKEAEADLRFLDKMKAACDEDQGMLYAAYNQTITKNTRLSSSGRKHKLQFQNFPRRYKRMFRARYKDWFVAEGDGVGMEFRIGAHLTRDSQALADIRNKKDVHKATASAFTGKSEDRVTALERQKYKPETFRPMYYSKGQTPEQKKYAKYFQGRYKIMYAEQTKWTHEVLKTKKLTTEWGFHFYWPDCSMDSRSGYIKYSTNIANFPISSFATGEIIPITLIFVWHYLKALKLKSFLVNTIHDSVVGEVPEYEKEEFTNICNKAFTHDTLGYLSAVYGVDLVVPLGVEIKYGTHWSEKDGGETIYEVDPLESSNESSRLRKEAKP